MASTKVLTNAVADILNKSLPHLQYEIAQTKKIVRNNEQKISQLRELIDNNNEGGGDNSVNSGNTGGNTVCSCKDFSKINSCEVMLQTINNNTGEYTRTYQEMTLEEFNELKNKFGIENPDGIDYSGTACIINLRDYNSYNEELIKEVASFRMIEIACRTLRITPTFMFDWYNHRTSPAINSFKIDRDVYPYITELIFDYGFGNYIYNTADINLKSKDDDGVQYFKYISNIIINGNVDQLTLNISNGESQPMFSSYRLQQSLELEPVEINTITFPIVRRSLSIDIAVPIAIDFLDISKINKIHQADIRLLVLTKPTVIKMSKIAEHDNFNVFYSEGNKPKLISDELTSEELTEYEAKMQVVTLTSNQ